MTLGNKLRALHPKAKTGRGRKLLKPPNPHPAHNTLLPTRLTCSSKATPPNPPQVVLLSGDLAFKYMSLWGPFLLRLLQFIKLHKCSRHCTRPHSQTWWWKHQEHVLSGLFPAWCTHGLEIAHLMGCSPFLPGMRACMHNHPSLGSPAPEWWRQLGK